MMLSFLFLICSSILISVSLRVVSTPELAELSIESSKFKSRRLGPLLGTELSSVDCERLILDLFDDWKMSLMSPENSKGAKLILKKNSCV